MVCHSGTYLLCLLPYPTSQVESVNINLNRDNADSLSDPHESRLRNPRPSTLSTPSNNNTLRKNGRTVTGSHTPNSSLAFESSAGAVHDECLVVKMSAGAIQYNSPRFPTLRRC